MWKRNYKAFIINQWQRPWFNAFICEKRIILWKLVATEWKLKRSLIFSLTIWTCYTTQNSEFFLTILNWHLANLFISCNSQLISHNSELCLAILSFVSCNFQFIPQIWVYISQFSAYILQNWVYISLISIYISQFSVYCVIMRNKIVRRKSELWDINSQLTKTLFIYFLFCDRTKLPCYFLDFESSETLMKDMKHPDKTF